MGAMSPMSITWLGSFMLILVHINEGVLKMNDRTIETNETPISDPCAAFGHWV